MSRHMFWPGASPRGWAPDTRRPRERGAVAVEAAIITPVLVVLIFGIIEFGMLFKDYLATASSVRAGVRIASAESRVSTFADDAAKKVADTATALNRDQIQQLWVYKADPATGKPVGSSSFASCSVCVKYRWDSASSAFVRTSASWSADTQKACGTSSSTGSDSVGVYLQVKHDAFTGLVFRSMMLQESSVQYLEPVPSRLGCS